MAADCVGCPTAERKPEWNTAFFHLALLLQTIWSSRPRARSRTHALTHAHTRGKTSVRLFALHTSPRPGCVRIGPRPACYLLRHGARPLEMEPRLRSTVERSPANDGFMSVSGWSLSSPHKSASVEADKKVGLLLGKQAASL